MQCLPDPCEVRVILDSETQEANPVSDLWCQTGNLILGREKDELSFIQLSARTEEYMTSPCCPHIVRRSQNKSAAIVVWNEPQTLVRLLQREVLVPREGDHHLGDCPEVLAPELLESLRIV